ncbi:unnamed protein product [Rotaria magnacalcarata]
MKIQSRLRCRITAPGITGKYGLFTASRLYARYFNGDLEIHSVDGHGTDAYVYLQAVEDQASEWLPICNRAAYEYYASRKYQSDWTKKK